MRSPAKRAAGGLLLLLCLSLAVVALFPSLVGWMVQGEAFPEYAPLAKELTFRDTVADVGIVFLPGRPYLVSVFVPHPWRSAEDEETAARIRADLSGLIDQYQVRLLERGPPVGVP